MQNGRSWGHTTAQPGPANCVLLFNPGHSVRNALYGDEEMMKPATKGNMMCYCFRAVQLNYSGNPEIFLKRDAAFTEGCNYFLAKRSFSKTDNE